LRIGVGSASADVILLERQLTPDLDQVMTVPLDVRQAEIVAEREPLLPDVLEVGATADG
jgi:hypothetical protein